MMAFAERPEIVLTAYASRELSCGSPLSPLAPVEPPPRRGGVALLLRTLAQLFGNLLDLAGDVRNNARVDHVGGIVEGVLEGVAHRGARRANALANLREGRLKIRPRLGEGAFCVLCVIVPGFSELLVEVADNLSRQRVSLLERGENLRDPLFEETARASPMPRSALSIPAQKPAVVRI